MQKKGLVGKLLLTATMDDNEIRRESPISKLNNDCLINIFKYLSIKERISSERGIFIIIHFYSLIFSNTIFWALEYLPDHWSIMHIAYASVSSFTQTTVYFYSEVNKKCKIALKMRWESMSLKMSGMNFRLKFVLKNSHYLYTALYKYRHPHKMMRSSCG